MKSADDLGAVTPIVSLRYGSFGVEQPIFYTLLIAETYFKSGNFNDTFIMLAKQ